MEEGVTTAREALEEWEEAEEEGGEGEEEAPVVGGGEEEALMKGNSELTGNFWTLKSDP